MAHAISLFAVISLSFSPHYSSHFWMSVASVRAVAIEEARGQGHCNEEDSDL